MKVLVTGGSGKVGMAATEELLRADYTVINADRVRPADRNNGVRFIQTDLSNVGQVTGAMYGCDAVLHLGAIPNPYGFPDEVVFGNNVMGTFVVLQAASLLGIKKAAIASSLSALGAAWSPKPFSPLYAPVDEEHPLLNHDCYGLSKEVDERTAQMFHRKTGMQVLCLRFHWVATPDETRRRAEELASRPDPDYLLRHLGAYVDIRDVATMCRLALEAEGKGFDVMQCTAADTLLDIPTEELIRTYAPTVEIRSPIPGKSTAFSMAKAERVLGWKPMHSWRD